MRIMKVALISGIYPPRIGGPASQTRQIALLLKEHNIEPFVVTFGENEKDANIDGIKVYYLNLYRGYHLAGIRQYTKACLRLFQIFRKEKPDIIHVQTGVDNLCILVSFINRILRKPSLVKYAGDYVWENLMSKSYDENINYDQIFKSSLKARVFRFIETFTFQGFTRIWATSDFQRKSLINHLHIEPQKIVKIPNYIEIEVEEKQTEKQKDRKELTVLTASRFVPWKRLDIVIMAFAMLDRDNAVLRIVGGENPELESQLKNLVKDLKIENRVDFVGPVGPKEIYYHYQTSDIFVSATEYEPFGIVFLEAMAYGLPIVTTSVGGIPEVVHDGKVGFLVETGNPRAIANKLRVLIDDSDLREKFSLTGQSRVRKFDLKKHIDELLNVYKSMS